MKCEMKGGREKKMREKQSWKEQQDKSKGTRHEDNRVGFKKKRWLFSGENTQHAHSVEKDHERNVLY